MLWSIHIDRNLLIRDCFTDTFLHHLIFKVRHTTHMTRNVRRILLGFCDANLQCMLDVKADLFSTGL